MMLSHDVDRARAVGHLRSASAREVREDMARREAAKRERLDCMMSASLMSAARKRAPSAPTPLSVLGANLIFWYDWTMGIGESAPSEIADWDDQSGNGNTAANADTGGTRPAITVSGVDFTTTPEFLDIADSASLDSATTQAVWGMKITPDVVTSFRVPLCRGASTSGEWSWQTNGAAMRCHIGTPGVAFGEGGSMTASATTYFLGLYDGGESSNATRLVMRQDGSGLTLSFPTGSIPASISTGTNGCRMGGYTNGVQGFDGKILAMFFGSVKPSAGGITDLETYLLNA